MAILYFELNIEHRISRGWNLVQLPFIAQLRKLHSWKNKRFAWDRTARKQQNQSFKPTVLAAALSSFLHSFTCINQTLAGTDGTLRNSDQRETDDRTINSHGAEVREINMGGESTRASRRGNICFLSLWPEGIRRRGDWNPERIISIAKPLQELWPWKVTQPLINCSSVKMELGNKTQTSLFSHFPISY